MVWVPGPPPPAVSQLIQVGVHVEGLAEGDTATPVAEPQRLVVSCRAFQVLSGAVGAEDAACDAIVSLVRQRQEFHRLRDAPFGCGPSLAPALRQVFFVGVSGPSCSGKSTIAASLASNLRLPALPVCLDNYFDTSRMGPCRPPEFAHLLDYEHPSGLSWEVLLDDLHRIRYSLSRATHLPQHFYLGCSAVFALATDIVADGARGLALGPGPVAIVLEGFLMFARKDVADLCAARVFVDADGQTCLARRWRRDGVRRAERWGCPPSAVPAAPPPKFERWFWEVVWSAFEGHRAVQQRNAAPWIAVDAGASTEAAVARVLEGVAAQGLCAPSHATLHCGPGTGGAVLVNDGAA